MALSVSAGFWSDPIDELRTAKAQQEQYKAMLGEEYRDYDLVIAQINGRPYEQRIIDKMFYKLIEELGGLRWRCRSPLASGRILPWRRIRCPSPERSACGQRQNCERRC